MIGDFRLTIEKRPLPVVVGDSIARHLQRATEN
jgi:hypothetical protein